MLSRLAHGQDLQENERGGMAGTALGVGGPALSGNIKQLPTWLHQVHKLSSPAHACIASSSPAMLCGVWHMVSHPSVIMKRGVLAWHRSWARGPHRPGNTKPDLPQAQVTAHACIASHPARPCCRVWHMVSPLGSRRRVLAWHRSWVLATSCPATPSLPTSSTSYSPCMHAIPARPCCASGTWSILFSKMKEGGMAGTALGWDFHLPCIHAVHNAQATTVATARVVQATLLSKMVGRSSSVHGHCFSARAAAVLVFLPAQDFSNQGSPLCEECACMVVIVV